MTDGLRRCHVRAYRRTDPRTRAHLPTRTPSRFSPAGSVTSVSTAIAAWADTQLRSCHVMSRTWHAADSLCPRGHRTCRDERRGSSYAVYASLSGGKLVIWTAGALPADSGVPPGEATRRVDTGQACGVTHHAPRRLTNENGDTALRTPPPTTATWDFETLIHGFVQ